MSQVLPPPARFEAHVPLVIVGAGAAGLVAALAAKGFGAEPVVIERDPVPRGSTALSAGLIPAAGTQAQARAGIEDSPERFAADLRAKAKGLNDPEQVATVAHAIAPAVDWLTDTLGLPLDVITNFTYPGHSACRMHGLPSRSGAELVDRLRAAAEAAGIDILTDSPVETLYAKGGRLLGLGIDRDGRVEAIGCDRLILACNGYGGNRDLIARHIPAIVDALYFGHAGNRGDALLWGQALGAEVADLSGHQGHGSVAHPHGILITWALMTEGGFLVNAEGQRFTDESTGYSEQAGLVLAQPGGVAWAIFDGRIAAIARQFEDFRSAEAAGAIVAADDAPALAARLGLPVDALAATCAGVAAMKRGEGADALGRRFAGVAPLDAPLLAIKVTGALFHTQGGLTVDGEARVCRAGGGVFPNLWAAGGAARGVSGPHPSGYLSGNGLLTAVAYGWLAGRAAAAGAVTPPA
jgi:fumarate reductase flavoprotein subunit